MADELETPDENEAKMKEILAHADAQINTKHTELMDYHHEAMQRLRAVKLELYAFKDRHDDIVDQIILIHTVAAKKIADLYGDIILAEEGLAELNPDEDLEEEPDDEQDTD